MSPTESRIVIAFYGLARPEEAAESFFDTAKSTFAYFGYHPDTLNIRGKGFTSKITDYETVKKKLITLGFSTITALDMHASKPGAEVPVLDYIASAVFSTDPESGGYAILSLPTEVVKENTILDLSKTLAAGLQPIYGIAFNRELRLGPIFYALGICHGLGVGLSGEAREEARTISRWANMGMIDRVYAKGLIRDVFPLNFLSVVHLKKLVTNKPLEDWILSDPIHGTLNLLCNNMYSWAVSPPNIPQIRDSLKSSGVIFDWRHHA